MSEYPEGISVIVPCYNEEGAIASVLEQIALALKAVSAPSEIIVVDDGSKDKTAEQIDTSRYRLIRHSHNRGYGAALKTGAHAARYDCIFITDGDGTYPNERIKDIYEQLPGADMVVGARIGQNVNIPLVRRPAKWIIVKLAEFLTGERIPDLNSGFRATRREVWERYRRYFPDGFSLTTTITLATLVNGHAVKFVPIDYHRRVGSSKIRPIRDTMNFVNLILRTVLYFDPIKVFLPISLGFMALGLFVGAVTLTLQNAFGIGKFLDITTLLLFLTGINLLAIGALADLITKRFG